MPGIYVDTSALGRVALREADAKVIRATLARFDPWHASELLKLEFRRLGRRENVEARVERILKLVTLAELTSEVLEQASRLDPPEVRSLDAIHLRTALDLHASGDITAVLSPGKSTRRDRRPRPASGIPGDVWAMRERASRLLVSTRCGARARLGVIEPRSSRGGLS